MTDHPSTLLGVTLSVPPLDMAQGDPELAEGPKGRGLAG